MLPPMRLSWRRVVLLLLVAHLAFGGIRVFHAAYAKRYRTVQKWRSQGEVAYHFGDKQEKARRVTEWLLAEMPEDQVVLYSGEGRGSMQILAALIAPRLLVHARSVPAGAERAAGRTIFTGRPSWLRQGGNTPVVVGDLWNLSVVMR